MIIGITNLKGGVGKSTLAQNLGVCLAHMGYRIAILDTDTNQNSLSWYGARDEKLPPLTVIGLSESETLSKSIANLHRDYEIILVDGTPNLSKMTTRIILSSDLLLIPVRPGAQDYRTLQEFMNRYEEAKAFREAIPAYFVMNEFSAQKKVHNGLLERISNDFDLPVVNTKINSRVAYTEASVVGQGVLEYADTKAKQEMINLTKEVLALAEENQLLEVT
ncbi:MAG: AAA family ATPase [Bacteroidota bacterium]